MMCVPQCVSVYFLLQYFISVTVLAMVPEIPEIVNGILFALQNNISLRYQHHLFHFIKTILAITLPCI